MDSKVQKLYALKIMASNLDRAMDEIAFLRARAERCTALYGSEPAGGGGSHDRVGDLAAMAADKAEEIKAMEREFALAYQECSEIIARVVKPDQRDILSMRFLQNMSVAEISSKRHYAESTVFLKQREGLKVIRESL